MTPKVWLWALISGLNVGVTVIMMWWYPPAVLALMFGITAGWAFREASWADR